ncbi:MAG: histidine kinase [Dehalococcoidia bacterium]|nr:histidine kinase [Dehalococcoidia bacterium]
MEGRKIHKRIKPVLSHLGVILLAGAGFGAAVGYFTPMGYPTAISMTLGCAAGIHIFQTLAEAYLYPRFENFPRGRKLIFQQATSLLAHILGWLLPIWIVSIIIGFSLFRGEVLVWLGIFIGIVLIIHLTHQAVNFYRELREKDLLEEKLKTLAAQAELKALRAQINPHFLFNSLNTIASLVNINPPKAEEAVERLADIFRYALSSSDKEFVTLRDELDFIDSYLEIEKARFGDKLKVSKDISPEILGTSIPSLVLQPLVENSIKHGSAENGEIRMQVTGFVAGDWVEVEVKDEGKGVPEDIRRGIYTNGTGLTNVNERLKKVYGDQCGLEIKENTPRGTVAVVTIPREKE